MLSFLAGNPVVKSKREFTVVIERDEHGYYVATVPTLRGCHTQARTLGSLRRRLHEVVALCQESREERSGSYKLSGFHEIKG